MLRKTVFIVALLFCWLTAALPVRAAAPPLRVYYQGRPGSVRTALEIARFTFVSDAALADVLVFNGDFSDLPGLRARAPAGAGLILIAGAPESAPDLAAGLTRLLGAPVEFAPLSEPISLAARPGSDGVTADILWNTAPQVRERFRLSFPSADAPPDFLALIQAAGDPTAVGVADSGLDAVLYKKPAGGAVLYLVAARLDGDNAQFRQWGYYNYFLYNLALRAAGRQPQSFGDYPGSPVPHPAEQIVLYLAMLLLLLFFGLAFLAVRRYSLRHPELLNTLVRDKARFTANEAGTDWEKIGFHRPLGGFMFALMTGIFLFIPMTIYQDMILPVYILPSAQAMGIYGRVAAFFPIVWSFFDMGTSVAHMKFFSEYRVRNPQRAIQYAQFFVWWQALTGAVQVALVVAVAGTFMPKSAYALYTWAVITHTMIQIPGFYRLFTDAFSGIQRSDYGTILDMGINMVFPMVAQPIVVSLMVWWGSSHPIFGVSMGGVLGLGMAAYLSEAMSFAFGWYLYRRLGYNSRLLLMAHFSKEVALDSLKYGFFLFLSGLIGGFSSSINVLVIQNRLLNNNEVLGNLGLAGSFVFAYTVFQSLTGAMMPSISEAVANGRRVLAQYYSANGYKYGGMVNGYIGAIMLAVADRFILGSSGPTFARAAIFVVPMLLSSAMSFATWNSDAVSYGAGKPRITTILTVLDLLLGFGLSYALVDRFQAYGLLAVPFITTPVRILLGYYLNQRYCYPQRFYAWQSLAAPLLAGAVHFLVVRGLTGLIWRQEELTSVIILVIALIPSYPLYAFLYGLFGGWDTNTLAVFDRGTRLASFMRPFTRLFYTATALGARLSPLHNRFPFTNHAEAAAEAQSLTEERVSLVHPG